MNFDYAIHSDFLIHWTGKYLDEKDSNGELKWCKQKKDKSETNKKEIRSYIKRLRDILQFGLWMTAEQENPLDKDRVLVPNTPKTCFTELKVSESRKHARRYGRLGIGVKRNYIFDRFGRPLIYFRRDKLKKDLFFKKCTLDFKDKNLLNFFKPMNSSSTLNYDLYSESEWRIIYFEELLSKGLIVDPRDPQNTDEYSYFHSLTKEEQDKLRYLIPLDGWFAMIIYPSLKVKNKAQQDDSTTGIKQQIKRIKDLKDDGNRVEGNNWPIEVDLDACRNF